MQGRKSIRTKEPDTRERGAWVEHSVICRFFAVHSEEESENCGSILERMLIPLRNFITPKLENTRLGAWIRRSFLFDPTMWCLLLCLVAIPFSGYVVVFSVLPICFTTYFARYCSDSSLHPVPSHMRTYVLLLGLIYLITGLFSSRDLIEWVVNRFVFTAVIFFVILNDCIRTKKQFHVLAYFLIGSATIVALYGIVQYMMRGSNFFGENAQAEFSTWTFRVYSTLVHPNTLANYLIPMIMIAFGAVFAEKKLYVKLLSMVSAIIMLVCILLTFSRGGWLGLLIAVALYFLIIDWRFLFLYILGIVGVLLLAPDVIVDRLMTLSNLTDAFTLLRVDIWRAGLDILKNYWSCGTGIAAFRSFVLPHYLDLIVTTAHVHNIFLQMACDIGIVGCIIFIVNLIFFFRTTCSSIHRHRRIAQSGWHYTAATLCGIIGYFAQGMVDNPFYDPKLVLMFWVVIAFGVVASRYPRLADTWK